MSQRRLVLQIDRFEFILIEFILTCVVVETLLGSKLFGSIPSGSNC